MSEKIAILRGINVGGKRKILMADLREMFGKMGHADVATYIQSGNVIFNSGTSKMDVEIADEIEKAITAQYVFDVPVIVFDADFLAKAIAENPFFQNEDADISQLHLTFLKEQPKEENRLKTEEYNFEPDEFRIQGKKVFLRLENKYHKTKLSNNFFEKKLKVRATTRNWKTVLKLAELSE